MRDSTVNNGPTATRFLLSTIRQRALPAQRWGKLENRIRQLAAVDQTDNGPAEEIATKRRRLTKIESDLDRVSENLARAETAEQFEAIKAVFDKLTEEAKSMRVEIAAAECQASTVVDADSAVETAMTIVHQLTDLASNPGDLTAGRQIFDLLNARLFLGFHAVKPKKRVINKIKAGVVTFGDAPPPIEIYEGPTARNKIKGPVTSVTEPCSSDLTTPAKHIHSGGEGKSLGNVSRGERIRTSDPLLPKQVR